MNPPGKFALSAWLKALPWRLLGVGVAAGLLLAFGLAWVSTRGQGFTGWLAFFGALLAAAGFFAGLLAILRRLEGALPGWLAAALLVAFGLRLGAGMLWYAALPVLGTATPPQNAGYVMDDAYQRDQAAWELATSTASLSAAFSAYPAADQYGGLLALSALVYRLAGGTTHQPLLMVVVAAAFSSAALLFTWGWTRRLWGGSAAGLAAWGLALYPEAVLLGSSQMREAFAVTLLALAVYGLVWQRQADGAAWRWSGWVLLAAGLGLALPLSPPYAGLSLAALAVLAAGLDEWRILRRKKLWLGLGLLALLALAGTWLAWERLAPAQYDNPLAYLAWFAGETAEYQAYLSQRASGWLQKIFRLLPEWLHTPFIIGYGVVQPLLPAALLAGGAPVWQGLGIWRAAGWTSLLFLLLFAVFPLARAAHWRKTAGAVFLAVWLHVLLTAFWGGGDQWDNPRYRALFASLQIGLAAWTWAEQRRQPSPWLRRALVGAALVIAWIIPWYARRYIPGFTWPVDDLFKTLGLGLASAGLYALWDWARGERHSQP